MEAKKKRAKKVESTSVHAKSNVVTKEKEPVMKEEQLKGEVPSASVSSTSAASTPSTSPAQAATRVVATMSDAVVKKCLTALGDVTTSLGDDEPLSTDEVRRSTKMRKGGAEIVPKILALCQQHNVTQIGSLTTAEMTEMLDRGNAIMQVGKRAELVQKKVRDATLRTHGRSWQIATTMYTTLKRLSVDDPELALGLQEVEEFFQTKKTKGKMRENAKARKQKELAKQVGMDAGSVQIPAGPGATSVPPAGGGAAPSNAPPLAGNAPNGGGAH